MVAQTLQDISTFSILLFLFIFTYTLLGRELFAHQVMFNSNDQVDLLNGTSPQANFDTFLFGFTTVFIILTNDNWSSTYVAYYRAVGTVLSTIYFFTLIIIG